MRTNHSGVTETAHLRTDLDKYSEGWDRIFGKKKEEVKCIGCEKALTEEEKEFLINTCDTCEKEAHEEL